MRSEFISFKGWVKYDLDNPLKVFLYETRENVIVLQIQCRVIRNFKYKNHSLSFGFC